MPKFTIEQTYSVPHYRHITVEAETLADALRLADEDQNWDNQKADFDSSGDIRVTGAWQSEEAYDGPALELPGAEREAPQVVEITMDGGLIQSLKAPRGVNVTVRDYDVEGSDEIVRKDANGDEFIEFGWEGNGEWQ